MLTIITTLIDFIFPPRATQRIVRALSTDDTLPVYRLNVHEKVHYLLPYQTQSVSALIKENKFYGNHQAASILAGILAQYLKDHTSGPVLLLPIPLSTPRQKARGYNQVESILKQLPTLERITTRTDILSRHKDTPPQTTQNRTDRLNNMKNVFSAVIPPSIIDAITVIIIDDVVTTGATLRSAKATLAPHLPASTTVLCLAIAH